MAAFIIFMNDLTDPEGYGEYLKVAMAAPSKGRVRIFGDSQQLEGEPPHGRVVAVEFPDRASAEEWYHSAAYQKAVPMRLASTKGFGVIVDGVPG
jgi:uncharacterized protein (DUF1330 family)